MFVLKKGLDSNVTVSLESLPRWTDRDKNLPKIISKTAKCSSEQGNNMEKEQCKKHDIHNDGGKKKNI